MKYKNTQLINHTIPSKKSLVNSNTNYVYLSIPDV